MSTYFCDYLLREGNEDVEMQVDSSDVEHFGGLCEFQNGFWINEKLRFTKSSDAKYWIPPSRIIKIEVVRDY